MSESPSRTVETFISRWQASGASERANFHSFLLELCDVLEVPHPDPATDQTAQNDYTFERVVTFDEGGGKTSSRFIDLYRRGCFVMEAKQGSDAPTDTEAEALTGTKAKRKQGTARRGTRGWQLAMEKAKNQARRYARALPADHGWPPLLIVVDVGYCFDVYADFSRQGKTYTQFPDAQQFRINLEDLYDEAVRERLKLAWTNPEVLDPSRRSARVTRALAEQLARLAASLEATGHEAGTVAQFLMRCLFTMFAEDVELLPERSFTSLLKQYREKDRLAFFPKALHHLWETMDRGGFSPSLVADIKQFNGNLFHDPEALALTETQLDLLIEAAKADWADVEPAIFGTLLERALDPIERHKLGAHYTPRAYVERLVMPTIIEPLRAEWAAVQAAALALEVEKDLSDKEQQKREREARGLVEAFLRRLGTVRILDPACGSGNFLYVTLEHLKRLEGEVLTMLATYGGGKQASIGQSAGVFELTDDMTVTPDQLLGLEINPRAAAIAEVVLWIGYLQWHLRTYGDATSLHTPILRAYHNIREQDAVLAYDERIPRLDADGEPVTRWDGRTTKLHPVTGEPVPDETARIPVYDYPDAKRADWPEADFIIGNPPFIGPARMRDALGDGYTEALRKAYKNDVPDSADFVMYWWHKAAERVRTGQSERFGLITTNSLPQKFNRRVVQAQMEAKEPLSLVYAIPDHPWVDDALGADVRIAMTVGEAGTHVGRLLTVTEEAQKDEIGRDVVLDEQVGTIQADLTAGADVAGAGSLKANENISSPGVKLHGSGFIVTSEEAEELGLGDVDGLEKHIRPYRNGRDLTQTSRGVMVIDLFGLTASEVRERFPETYQWIYERVKPARDQNNRAKYRDYWWIFGEPRSDLRPALEGLPRYIATVETSKHRFFQFLDASILPDNMLVVIASDDAYHLGVLSSRFHVVWALAAGGSLEDRPRYNKTRCFETYPFPAATDAQKETIRTLAESLDAHRKRQLAAHDALTMTDLYNVLDKLRSGKKLTEKEQAIHRDGLVSVLRDLHDDLDAAVAAAYDWPADLSDAQILERLVALNAERAEEEARGIIRYLRPAYQNPEGVQQGSLDVETTPSKTTGTVQEKQPWPTSLAERMQAVHQAVASEDRPATVQTIASRFQRAPRKTVQDLLETLEALGHVRQTEDGCYVV